MEAILSKFMRKIVKKLKEEAERMKSLEKPEKLKGLEEALKPETIGIRSNKAVKTMLNIMADVTDLDKKDVITYFILRCFVEIWRGAPEPVKEYSI